MSKQKSVRMLSSEIKFAIHGRSTRQRVKVVLKALISILHEPFLYVDRMKSTINKNRERM